MQSKWNSEEFGVGALYNVVLKLRLEASFVFDINPIDLQANAIIPGNGPKPKVATKISANIIS